MDQDKQTLLEAAKAMSRACDGTSRWDVEVNRFRAAIAREEAHPSPTTEANDRAQQAEADAKWHREESERLSVCLTRMIAERDYLQGRVDDTDGRIAAMEIHGNSADHWYRKATAYKDAFRVRDEAVKRAEKAEAELAKRIDMKVNPVVFAPEPSKVEMQTHVFGSKEQFYGESPYQTAKDASEAVDPCTGWTFATYRRVVEALGGKS